MSIYGNYLIESKKSLKSCSLIDEYKKYPHIKCDRWIVYYPLIENATNKKLKELSKYILDDIEDINQDIDRLIEEFKNTDGKNMNLTSKTYIMIDFQGSGLDEYYVEFPNETTSGVKLAIEFKYGGGELYIKSIYKK